MHEFETSIEIKNNSEDSVLFSLEPWGDQCVLKSGSTVRVTFRSRRVQSIPVTETDNGIVVEGVEGVEVIGVWLDGLLIG